MEIRKCIVNFSGKQESKPLVLYKLNGDTAPNRSFIKKGKCYVMDKCLASYKRQSSYHTVHEISHVRQRGL